VGCQAVDGVHNIITKSAKLTPVAVVSAGVGTRRTNLPMGRYGVQGRLTIVTMSLHKIFDWRAYSRPTGTNAPTDGMHFGGFRVDRRRRELIR